MKQLPLLAAAALLSSCAVGLAGISMPPVFGDNMVLQRGQPLPVWGTAGAEETIVVSFAGQKQSATADTAGKWKVLLDPLPASAEPRTLAVTAGNDQPAANDHWQCSNALEAHRVRQHELLFPLLVREWRVAWGENLPFLYCQLSSIRTNHYQSAGLRASTFEIPVRLARGR